MNARLYKTQKDETQSVTDVVSRTSGNEKAAFQLVDNRPEIITQRKLSALANSDHSAKRTPLSPLPESKLAAEGSTIQRKEKLETVAPTGPVNEVRDADAHQNFPQQVGDAVIQAKNPKEWWQDRKAQVRAWNARRRARRAQRRQGAPQVAVENDMDEMAFEPRIEEREVEMVSENDSSSVYEEEVDERRERVFTKEEIVPNTKATERKVEPDYLEQLGLPKEKMTRVETFPKEVTGDKYGTAAEEMLNFDNLYGEHTWVMENNFRDKSRSEGFWASDVVDEQVKAAGLGEDAVPEFILRKNVVNKVGLAFLANNEGLLQKEFPAGSSEFDTLNEKIPNIKSTGNIVSRRGAKMVSLRIEPRPGNEYMIIIGVEREEN